MRASGRFVAAFTAVTALFCLTTLARADSSQIGFGPNQSLDPRDFLGVVRALGAPNPPQGAAVNPDGDSQQFDQAWHDYALTASGCSSITNGVCQKWAFHVQPHCVPEKFPAQGDFKGTVIMFTGFTNCPQEFYALKDELVQRGYEVLLPLLPGHGHNRLPPFSLGFGLPPPKDGDDDLSAMPTKAGQYEDFIKQMNLLMKLSRSGQKILVGHSVGGAMAFRALELDPGLYSRAVLIAPYFKTSTVKTAGITVPAMFNRAAGNMTWWWDWGPINKHECQGNQDDHKAVEGYCSFHLNNLQAALDLGAIAYSNAQEVQTPFQVVGVVNDDSAGNGTTVSIINELKPTGRVQACFLKDVPHAMLDPLKEPHPWLPEMLDHITQYLDEGTPYPTGDLIAPAITIEPTTEVAIEVRLPETGFPYCAANP